MIVRFERRGAGEYLITSQETGHRLGRLIKRNTQRWDIYFGASPEEEHRVTHGKTLALAQRTARYLLEHHTVPE
jgi:hypothetical protein